MPENIIRFSEDQRSVDEILQEAKEQGFEFVAVVGMSKDGSVHTKASKTSDALRVLGALTLAADEFLKNWD